VNLVSIVSFLSVIAWMITIGVVALLVIRSTRGRPMPNGFALLLVSGILAIALSVLAAGLVFIQPSERGVVITVGQGGIRPNALQPGLHWVVPFAENVIPYSIARQTYTMSVIPEESQVYRDDAVEARTSDGQVVHVDASVIYSIDPNKVINLHIQWQDRYTNGLVRPVVRGIIRDAVAQFGIEEVYSTKRLELTTLMAEEIERRFEANGIDLIDFVLRNIAFSPEYAASVEQKQIAEQLSQQAAFVVEQRRQEAEQARQVAQGQADAAVIAAQGEAEARLIQAEAEAQALQLLGDAIAANPGVLTLQYIEKLAPNISVMLVPNDNPFLLPLPNFSPQ
jgi:regulator of protease activity HflC (stomatin/prohibitin superfamily)